jgi:TatA/E family protein of Tat protein translocase
VVTNNLLLLIFEFLGTTELIVILVVALILFGPRKLPQISRTVGKSLSDFKRASEDFKRTWEREVDLEGADRETEISRAMLPEETSPEKPTVARKVNAPAEDQYSILGASNDSTSPAAPTEAFEQEQEQQPAPVSPTVEPSTEPTLRKRDWL